MQNVFVQRSTKNLTLVTRAVGLACFFVLAFLVLPQMTAAQVTLSGTVYSDAGTTVDGTARTIAVVVGTSTPGRFSSSSFVTTGAWTITIPTGHDIATGTPLVIWIDNEAVDGSLITKASTSNDVSSITGLDIYRDLVTLKQASGTAAIKNADLSIFDSIDDADLRYTTTGNAYDVSIATFDSVALFVGGEEITPTAMLFNNDGTILYVMGDTGGDINAYPLPTPYNIASYTSGTSIVLSVVTQELSPRAMLFNNDGTILYVMGVSGDDINAYPLPTPYNIASYASGTSIALSVAGQEIGPTAMLFNDDGTILYVLGLTGDEINAYPLPTPYNIASYASGTSIALSIAAEETSPYAMLFNNDGTILYMMGEVGDDINAYPLPTPYNIASYTSGTSIVLSVVTQDTNPRAMLFNNTGTILYVMGQAGDDINAYNINVDLTVHAGQELFVTASSTYTPVGAVTVSGNAGSGNDGSLRIGQNATLTTNKTVSLAGNFTLGTSSIYTNTNATGTVFTATTTGKTLSGEFDTLGHVIFNGSGGAWTFTGAATTSDFTIATGTVTAPTSTLAIKGDFTQNGTFINNGGAVQSVGGRQYDIPTAVFDSIALSVATEDSAPRNTLFNQSGTILYLLGDNGDDITAYPLPTPYNIASFTSGTSTALSVATEETSPRTMLFNNTGTILYVLGQIGDDITAYPLPIPYNIASFTSGTSTALSVATEETTPNAMLFNNDGTILYVLGLTGLDINAYPLPTPYNIASYTSGTSIALSIAAEENTPTAMLFNNTGTILYVLGQEDDAITAYPLPTPYNIASYTSGTSIALSVAEQDTAPTGMFFNNDGTTLYVIGNVGDDINAYTMSTTYSGTMTGTSAFNDFAIADARAVKFATVASTTGTMSMDAGSLASFDAGSAYTFENIDWQGASGRPVILKSSDPGNVWYLDVPGDQLNVRYVNVSDSNATSTVGGVTALNSTNLGNNTNWNFSEGAVWNATDWILYDTLTIDADNIDADLTDFPVYLSLADLSAQFWSTTPTGSSTVGTDIRVTTADNVEIPRELVFASSTLETGELHFKAPSISSTTDTVFKIWYNGTTTGDYATTSTYGAQNVWSNDFVAVWHLQEDPSVAGAGGILDVTGNGNHGTDNGSMDAADAVSGKLGGRSLDFDGTNDFIQVTGLLGGPAEVTVSAWANIDTYDSGGSDIVSIGDYIVLDTTAANTRGNFYNGTAWVTLLGTSNGAGVWNHMVYTQSNSGNQQRIYKNNIKTTGSNANNTSYTGLGPDTIIGKHANGQTIDDTDGRIDEVRIASTTRTDAWVKAEYFNQSTTTDFYTLESSSVPLVSIGNHPLGQVTNTFGTADETDEPLFAFTLTPEIESASTTITLTLSNTIGLDSNNLSDWRLYRDSNSDGALDGGDVQVGGAGTFSITSVIFATPFLATTSQAYMVTADVTDIEQGDRVTMALTGATVNATSTVSGLALPVTGSISSTNHLRSKKAGGGGSVNFINIGAPGNGIVGGGSNEGGEELGGEPNFNPPASNGSPHNEWTTGGSGYLSDGSYTTETTAGQRQSYGTYGFNIPTNNEITGIEVKIEASATTPAGTIEVALSWDDGTSITTVQSTATLTTTDTIYTLGSPSDLWGRAWVPSEFSNGLFGLRIIGQPSGGNTVQVDAMQVRVYHQATGGGAGGGGGEL